MKIVKLSDMKDRPKKAGKVIFKFSGREDLPCRKGRTIILSDRPINKFVELKNGKQFLFVNKHKRTNHVTYWFGGTDVHPFLVQIVYDAFEAYKKKDEKGFYKYLKPKIIRRLEKMFGKKNTKRQGCIWAYPLPVGWKIMMLLNKAALLCDFVRTPLDSNKLKKLIKVFDTRHKIKGLYWEARKSSRYAFPVALAKGVLKARAQKPIELKKVHVLAQTCGLHDSTVGG